MPAILIFAITYLALAIGRLPGLRIDRTGAAIIGASFMVGVNALSLDEAYRAINFDTIILLFGMMIVVANLQLSGFFALIAERVVERAHSRLLLLIAIVAVSGVFSAFFVNDTMCLVLTPLTLEIAEALRSNPVPYLLAVAMAANIGSVATITGNPQNMMIGSFSGIPYRHFIATLGPVALIGLVLAVAAVYLSYRGEFRAPGAVAVAKREVHVDRGLMWKSLAIALAMIVMFFVGWPVPKVAIVAGAILLITRRVHPDQVYERIDWPLLVMFAGLFIVIAGVEKTSLETQLAALTGRLHLDNVFLLSWNHRAAIESAEQCAGRAGIQAVHRTDSRSVAGLAGAGNGVDAGRKSDRRGIGGEPDRDPAGSRQSADRLLGIFSLGSAAGCDHAAGGRGLDRLGLLGIQTFPPQNDLSWLA